MDPSDFTQLRKDVKDLPDEIDKASLIADLDALERECRLTNEFLERMRADEEERNRQLRKKSLFAIPVLFLVAIGFGWYVISALADGYVTYRQQVISSVTDPIYYWFQLIWPAGGIVTCVVIIGNLMKVFSAASQRDKR